MKVTILRNLGRDWPESARSLREGQTADVDDELGEALLVHRLAELAEPVRIKAVPAKPAIQASDKPDSDPPAVSSDSPKGKGK